MANGQVIYSVCFLLLLLLDLQGNVPLIHLLNATELRSLTNIKTYKHNSFGIFFFYYYSSELAPLKNKNKISIKQVKG